MSRLGPAEGPWQTGINARACIATHQWKSGSSALHESHRAATVHDEWAGTEWPGVLFGSTRGTFSPLSASCQAEGDWS